MCLTHRLTHLALAAVLVLLCSALARAADPGSSAADLVVTKTDSPDPVLAGTNLTYTINFINNGNISAQAVTVTDAVPPNTTFVSASVTTGTGWVLNSPSAGSSTGNVVFSKSTVGSGETAIFQIVVRINSNTASGTIIPNSAVAATATPESDGNNNTGMTTTTVITQADLSVTKTAPATALAGANFTYNFTLANAGPSSAANATFTDVLPATTVFVSNTVPTGFTCVTPAANTNGTVTCTAPAFNSGASVTLSITVRLSANVACNTSIANQATFRSQTFDEIPGNNAATATMLAQSQADLAITSTGAPNPAPAGGTVNYTLTVTNSGPSDSVGTRVSDTLPPGFTADSVTSSAGTCGGTGTGNVNCVLGTLAAGSTATITIAAHVPAICQPTTAVNTATVANDNCLPDPQLGNNTTTFTSAVNVANGGPGACLPVGAPSTTKPGSVLVFPFYTSAAANSNDSNTRVVLTNTHPTLGVALHLFFVDGATCSVADVFLCLTANQTAAFLLSDIDPGVSGYMIAVAVDGPPGFAEGGNTGCPISFNYLIGHASIKLPVTGGSGFASFGNGALAPTKKTRVETDLAAESIAAEFGSPVPGCNANSFTAELRFDGTTAGYDRLPRVLAASNIPSRADGNDTLLIINRIGGSLATGAATLGTLFGILYDDAENGYSFQLSGACQLRGSLSNNFPRTAPRFDQLIPAGRSGWLKIYGLADIAIIGAMINNNVNSDTAANAFDGGHMLHKLTLTSSAVLTVPVFPPNC